MRTRLTIVALLALLHLFVAITLVPDLPLNAFGRWLAWLYLAASTVLMPLGVRPPGGRRWLAWTGLLAMGCFPAWWCCRYCGPGRWRCCGCSATTRRR